MARYFQYTCFKTKTMKNIIKLAVPVLLASFVTLSVSAQTQPAPTKAATPATAAKPTKADAVNKANEQYTKWEQKYNDMKTKQAKNKAAQASLNTIQADLASYKSAITAYSAAAEGAPSQKADQQVKSAHQKLMTDWNAAKAKFGETK